MSLSQVKTKFDSKIVTSRKQQHYRKLREQYKKFVDEDRRRQERNEVILNALERIEGRSAILAAKSERLNFLRRQYQNFVNQTRVNNGVLRETKTIRRSEDGRPVLPEYGHNFEGGSTAKLNQCKKDIVDKYLENLVSQKSTMGVLENFETSPQRYPFTMTLNDEKVSASSDLYGDGFAKGDAPGTAIAVADEIMNTIHLQKQQDLKNNATFDINTVKNDATDRITGSSNKGNVDAQFKSDIAVNLKKEEISVNNNDPKSEINAAQDDFNEGVSAISKTLQHEDEIGLQRMQQTKNVDRQINDERVATDETPLQV